MPDETHETNEHQDLVLREEEAHLGVETRDAGRVRVRKRVETDDVTETVPLAREEANVERVPAAEDDTGEVETLPDGSVSIPVLAEEVVVTKRVVVRERLVVRKRVETEDRRVETSLRREVAEVERDDAR